MNDHLFFSADSTNIVKNVFVITNEYHFRLWRPGIADIVPSGIPMIPFGAWWALHQLHVFANRDYCLSLIYHDGILVHRSCVFPPYFRFPFMGKHDLQIGDTWTDDKHRGRNLAVFAMQKTVELLGVPGRRFWYVTTDFNRPSIRVAEKTGFSLAGKGRRVSRCGIRQLGAFVIEHTPSQFNAESRAGNGPLPSDKPYFVAQHR